MRPYFVRSYPARLAVFAAVAVGAALIGLPLPAQEARLSGTISAGLSALETNETGLYAHSPAASSSMAASLASDWQLSLVDRDLGQVFLDADVSGSLANAAAGGSISPAPVSMAVNQLYFQVPLGPAWALAVGKMSKEWGYASFFNVSNRLSPRSLADVAANASAPGLATLDFYALDRLNLGAFFYFSDPDDWRGTSEGLALRLGFGSADIDLYGYYERQEFPMLGYNAALQLDRLKIYAEGLWSSRPTQAALIPVGTGTIGLSGNPLNDIIIGEAGVSIQQAAGMQIDLDRSRIICEYLYRSEGRGDDERQRLFGYLLYPGREASLPIGIGRAWRFASFDSHYLALSISRAGLFPSLGEKADLSAWVIASAGREAETWKNTASVLSNLSLDLRPSENLGLSLSIRHVFGGADGEFTRFFGHDLVAGLSLTYHFLARQEDTNGAAHD